MFKKNSWIAALLLAAAIVFTGCLEPLGETDTTGLVPVTLLDLSPVLQKIPVGPIPTEAAFKAAFAGVPVQAAGSVGGQAIFEIKEQNGKNVLDVVGTATWGAGFDLRHADINFEAGDTIYIKGQLLSGDNFFLNKNPGAGVAKVADWEFKGNGATFSTTLTLSAGDVGSIKGSNPPTIRLRSNGETHYVIEELKVVGLRAGGGGVGGGPSGYQSPSGSWDVTYDAALDQFYFYVDLNLAKGILAADTSNYYADPPEIAISNVNAKLTYAPTNQRPAVAFFFTDDQSKSVIAELKNNNPIFFTWEATNTQVTCKYRYYLGDGKFTSNGGSWTGSNGSGIISIPFAVASQTGNNVGTITQKAIMLQNMASETGAAITNEELTINSIKVSWAAPTIAVVSTFTINPLGKARVVNAGFLDNAALKGDVINWQNAAGTAPATFDYEAWDTGKNFPRFTASTTYLATIKLSAKGGYLMDGWANGKQFTVTGADASPTVAGTGNSNTSYNSNDQTIKVTFTASSNSTKNVWQLGDYDPTISITPVPGNSIIVYNFDINSKAGQFVDAGSSIEKVGAGINVTRSADAWRGVDIKIKAVDINLVPEIKRYKITVGGLYVGGTSGSEVVQIGQTASPYAGLGQSAAMTTGANQTFTVSGEIPSDYIVRKAAGAADQTAIRVNTNSNAGNFRVTKIVIEDKNVARIPILPTNVGLTGTKFDLELEAPAFDATPNTTLFNAPTITGQTNLWEGSATALSSTVTWKLDNTNVTGNFKNYAYTAVIVLSNEGTTHTWNGVTKDNFNVNDHGGDPAKNATVESAVVSANGRTITITAKFPATTGGTVINGSAISGITAPAINTTDATSLVAPTGATAGAVTWTPALSSSTFIGSTVYTAKFTLTADTGNTFKGSTGNFTVAGATVTKDIAADGKTCAITAVFPKTADPTKVPAGSIAITAPVTNVVPQASLTGLSLTGVTTTTAAITWSPTPPGGKFKSGVVYTATINLNATPITYTFTGATAFANTTGGTVVQTAGGTLAQSTAKIVVTFPKTTDEVINSGTVNITAPVVGNSPQYTAIAGVGSNFVVVGDIVWTVTSTGKVVTFDSAFANASGYTATFVLKANDNYTFGTAPTITAVGGSANTTGQSGKTITVKVNY